MSATLIAPACLVTSLPFLKITIVGILRIFSCAPIDCSSSVFNFASLTPGERSRDACSKAGAIILQGPHHGAQKSTTTGISLLFICLRKLSAFSVTGSWLNSALRHLPQAGPASSFSAGIRFVVLQNGHTICFVLLIILTK